MNKRDQQKLEQAIAQANQGEKKKAYAELRRLQEKYPSEVNIWLWLAFTAPDPQTARQAVVEATRLNPGDAAVRAAHRWLGDQERLHGIAPRPAVQPNRANQPPAQPRVNPVAMRPQQPPPAYYQPANQWQNPQPPAPAQEPNPLMVAAGAAAVGALAGYALGQASNDGNSRLIQTRFYGSGIVGRIIGSISLIIGLIITLAVCWAMRDSIIASLTFNRTEGTITKIGRETTPTDGTLLVIIVRYRDKQYRQYEERWQYKTSQTAYEVNDKVQVLYEPANPTNFRIDNFDAMWQAWMGWLGIGCLFLLFIPLICLIAINAGTVRTYGYRSQRSNGASSVSWGETDDSSNGSSSVSWGETDDGSNGSSSVSWGNDDGNGGEIASFFGGGNDNENGNGGSSFF